MKAAEWAAGAEVPTASEAVGYVRDAAVSLCAVGSAAAFGAAIGVQWFGSRVAPYCATGPVRPRACDTLAAAEGVTAALVASSVVLLLAASIAVSFE